MILFCHARSHRFTPFLARHDEFIGSFSNKLQAQACFCGKMPECHAERPCLNPIQSWVFLFLNLLFNFFMSISQVTGGDSNGGAVEHRNGRTRGEL